MKNISNNLIFFLESASFIFKVWSTCCTIYIEFTTVFIGGILYSVPRMNTAVTSI